jgi:F-type H+-transporting ATPase subunit b
MQIHLTPDLSLLVIMAIFIANYFVVRKFFLRPINEILNWREEQVRSADKIYEESLARFEEATADVESRLQASKREASKLREERRAEAMSVRNDLIGKARGEADRAVAEAEAKITADVTAARTTIERDSEQLARLAAERIVGRKIG